MHFTAHFYVCNILFFIRRCQTFKSSLNSYDHIVIKLSFARPDWQHFY